MSYSGYDEFICPDGHYWAVSSGESYCGYLPEHTHCDHCGKMYRWLCIVDQTNGIDKHRAATYSGPKTEIGFDDIVMHDHYNNKYFIKRLKYEPVFKIKHRWRTNQVDDTRLSLRKDEDGNYTIKNGTRKVRRFYGHWQYIVNGLVISSADTLDELTERNKGEFVLIPEQK